MQIEFTTNNSGACNNLLKVALRHFGFDHSDQLLSSLQDAAIVANKQRQAREKLFVLGSQIGSVSAPNIKTTAG